MDTGSKPGVSMNTRPRDLTGSAKPATSTRFVPPPLARAPRDFSRMVVMPPCLLPGVGLLFNWAPLGIAHGPPAVMGDYIGFRYTGFRYSHL